MKRLFHILLAFGLWQSAHAAERPNIVIMLADDLGYGDLSCYGHDYIRTPNIDRLAGQGWRCTQFYAAAPMCSPSRAGLLTGRTPNRTGVFDWIAHDVIEELVGTDASFGVTLGDIVFDDLNMFESQARSIALLGIPWYNVVGNSIAVPGLQAHWFWSSKRWVPIPKTGLLSSLKVSKIERAFCVVRPSLKTRVFVLGSIFRLR